MSEYDNRGQVALWKNESDNDKAPNARGTVVAHRDIKEGETVDIALWRNQSDNPKAPMMKGKIQDRKQDSHNEAKSNGYQSGGSDDIPFMRLMNEYCY